MKKYIGWIMVILAVVFFWKTFKIGDKIKSAIKPNE